MAVRRTSDKQAQATPNPTYGELVTQAEWRAAESDALFFSIGEGAIVTDAQGRISRINQVALDILGYERHELMGAWYPAVVVAEDEDGKVIPKLERPITNVFVEGRPISARLCYRRKDGSRITVSLTVSPVMLDGLPIGAIEVFRDITREAELERAKDEFISLASHQLRTPASAVKQYAGMMLQGFAGKMTPQQLKMAQTIFDSNERQIKIVNDLLRVAQVDAGKVQIKPETVDLDELVRSILDEHTSDFAARKQHVNYGSAPKPFEASMDPQLMRMVLENIVDNASKYTPAGKNLSITLRRTPRFVVVEVADEGVGIASADIPRIFQKFSRLPNALSNIVGGTGLGLYWAKKVVDLHGGTIRVRSKEDGGSTFSIRIPHNPIA